MDKMDVKIKNAVVRLRRFADLHLEICGAWLWISGDTPKHIAAIEAVGGQFASRKGIWYVRPSYAKRINREEQHMADIRQWFGSVQINR